MHHLKPRRIGRGISLGLLTAWFGMLLSGTALPDTQTGAIFVPALPEAQRSSDKSARILRHPAPGTVLAIELPEVADLQAKNSPNGTGPRQIGFGRRLPDAYQGDLTPQLTWEIQGDGSYITVVEITSPDAKGMRAGLRALAAAGVVLRFFDPKDSTATFPAHLPKSKSGLWEDVELHWSPTVSADSLGIEIYAPNWSAAQSLRLEIERISHVFVDLHAPQSSRAATESSGENSCTHTPAACKRTDSNQWVIDATVRLTYVNSDGDGRACTGTILNDSRSFTVQANNATIYTAAHCINSPGVARNLELQTHFGTASCDSTEIDHRYQEYTGGADLLNAADEIDQSLLRLRRPLTGHVFFSGWSPTKPPVDSAFQAVHHAQAQPKMWAAGRIQSYGTTTDLGTGQILRDMMHVNYTQGHTEPGSSGSGIAWDSGSGELLIAGSLFGGSDDCSSGSYGVLHEFYPHISQYLGNENPQPPPTEDDHGNTRPTSTEIAVNTTTSGQLESSGDIDYFTFTVHSDGEVTIESIGSTDTIGTLYNAQGQELQSNDDGGDHRNFRLSMELTLGTYYVSVRGYEESVGDYELSVRFNETSPPPPPPTGNQTNTIIPLMLSADLQGREGFLRIQNNENNHTTLEISGIDAHGLRYGPISHTLKPSQSVHFNSTDIERGNPDKGLTAGLGKGNGGWRLQLSASASISATSYVRTQDGFLTSLHDTAPNIEPDGTLVFVPIFNPASNVKQRSSLFITNLSDEHNRIVISGIDDEGAPSLASFRGEILSSQSVELDAVHLEHGIGEIDSGRLGDGSGKWRLFIEASHPIRVLSLMETPEGHVTNLSTPNSGSNGLDTQALLNLMSSLNRLRTSRSGIAEHYPILEPGFADHR